MKRVGCALAVVILTAGLAGPARAVPPGFTLEFDGKGEGKVIFSGAAHSSRARPHCADCHMELFDVSRSAQITRADHRRKQFCFVCHDGKTAFASRSNCDRCHLEPEEPPAGPTSPGAAACSAPTTHGVDPGSGSRPGQ